MYTLPTFNLECAIFTGADFDEGARLTSECNLAFGRRTSSKDESDTGVNAGAGQFMYLLLPALTDIRPPNLGGNPADGVEVPADSGRFYLVLWVDDSGKGFPNEHRVATIIQTNLADWPIPIP